MSDNVCDSVNNQVKPETTVSALSIDALSTAPGDFGRVIQRMQPSSSVELPKVDIFETAGGFDQNMKNCLATNYRVDDQRPAFSKIAGLSQCDPRFQVLVKDLARTCNLTEEGRERRSTLAREIINFTREDERAKNLMTPFMEQLYQEAYNFFMPPKR